MTLRLVLVSIVACVGLSLPSAERLERWMHSGSSWRHAGDAAAPLDDGRFIMVADAAPAAPAPPPAPVVPTVEAAAPAPSALEVVDQAEAAAFEADWLAAIAREAAPPAANAVDPTMSIVADDGVVPIPTTEPAIDEPVIVTADERAWWDAWLAEMGQPLLPDAPEDAVAVASPAPPQIGESDAAFRAIVDEMAATFTKDLEAQAARVQSEQARALQAQTDAPAAPAATESTDRDDEVAAELAAYGLDGTERSMADAPTAIKASIPRENRLAHAVRLTREAVNAWASLLHGPALVTIER